MKPLTCLAACLLIAAVAQSCASEGFVGPSNLVRLSEFEDSAALTNRYFPGMTGSFYASADKGTPVFGVVQDPADPGSLFIAGAGKERSWSVAVPLEAPGFKVSKAQPLVLQSGDLQRDGVMDLLLVLSVEAADEKGGRSQKRTALYLFELSKKIRLTWYGSLSFDGAMSAACSKAIRQVTRSPQFVVDESAVLRKMVLSFDRSSLSCKGGEGCPDPMDCVRNREEGEQVFVWDAELRLWVPEGASDAMTQVPDVSM
jgi:hypothetical protein